MSFLLYHHARRALAASSGSGIENFSSYPDVVFPTRPLGPPVWSSFDNQAQGSVTSDVLTVQARHNNTAGLRYTPQVNTAGRYVRVLVDWYAGITDAERRILFDVNSVAGISLAPVMFYYADNSAQVAISEFNSEGRCTSVHELTGRPNSSLPLSTSEPTWLELFVPPTSSGNLEARTWGQSQPRPSAPGYSAQVASLNSQYGTLSLSGQLVLRSIQEDTARVRKTAILSTP